jgi:hypothetical protein
MFNMKNNILTLGLAGILASLAATASTAAPLTFSSSTGFAAAIAGAPAQGTDGFVELTDGAPRGAGPLNRSAGTLGYQISDPFGFYAGLSADGFLTNERGNGRMTVEGLGANVNAFGANFFGSGGDGAPTPGAKIVLYVLESDNDWFAFTLDNTDRASYFGYIGDSALTSVSMEILSGSDFFVSIDNLTLASMGAAPTVVPEPSALALVGLALAGLALSRRRRA